jgi:hypothetical protein
MDALKPKVPTLGQALGGAMGLPLSRAADALKGGFGSRPQYPHTADTSAERRTIWAGRRPIASTQATGFRRWKAGRTGIDWNRPLPPPRPITPLPSSRPDTPIPVSRPMDARVGYNSPPPSANPYRSLVPPQRVASQGPYPTVDPATGRQGEGQAPYNPRAYGSLSSKSAMAEMIRANAIRTGQDPELMRKVAAREGLNNYVGDHGSSFGPFQMHMGGLAPGKNSGPGLGDVFKKETGLDPRDPATVPRQIKWVADYTAKHGWSAFHGARGGMRNISGSMGEFLPPAGSTPLLMPHAGRLPPRIILASTAGP